MKSHILLKIVPHPNILKIINTYILFVLLLFTFCSFWLIHEIALLLFVLLFGLLISFLGTIYFRHKFLKTVYFLEKDETSFFCNKAKINLKHCLVSSCLLERAYGVATIKFGSFFLRGIHVEDVQKILKWGNINEVS